MDAGNVTAWTSPAAVRIPTCGPPASTIDSDQPATIVRSESSATAACRNVSDALSRKDAWSLRALWGVLVPRWLAQEIAAVGGTHLDRNVGAAAHERQR